MRKEIAISLRKKAAEVAEILSNPNRENNPSGETFEIANIIPLSETTAGVVYLKSSGKLALACFFYVKDFWLNWLPTDPHLLAMQYLADMKKKIEASNYKQNFEDDSNQ